MVLRYVGVLAAMLAVNAQAAVAQEAAATAGGDVTADEATPLPPVTVQSASEPIQRNSRIKRSVQAGSNTNDAPTPATPSTDIDGETGIGNAEGSSTELDEIQPVGIFTLGQLDLIGGATITNEAMRTFNRGSLDAAASVVPGVSVHSSGGSRNERDIFVRGFDRQRVPLYVDGVRIYLPADNRLDFNRFLTPDLAEIQFQKGYVSVLNGPGGLGGAINLVSRKPTKEIELEARSGTTFSGNADDLNAWSAYAFAGTRQKGYYAQISGNIVDQEQWNLSDDFNPILTVNEDGGARDQSGIKDWRVNAKVGLTPNATDEYTLNYTTQGGEKSAPLHVAGQRVPQQRFWTWPYWDVQSLSWLSKTQVGDRAYVKTNAFYNTFDNLLQSFNGPDYSRQTRTQDFDSYYDDYAAGGFVEAGIELSPASLLKGAIHYRRDNHKERSDIAPDGATVNEPWQESVVDTWSFALEHTLRVTRNIDVVTGVSYDVDDVLQAQDFRAPPSGGARVFVEDSTVSKDAWNGQGAAIYSYSDTGKTHFSVSSRTRFPTLFDRYSTRFDTRLADPNINPERSTNYEVGWTDTVWKGMTVSTAIFYSDLKDSIQNVQVGASGGASILGLNADGEHYGFEVSADWDIAPGLRIGGNYTYLERNIDFAGAAARLPGTTTAEITRRNAAAAATEEGTPRHEAFLYLAWDVTEQVTLTPSVELASDRSSLITGANSTLLSATVLPNYAHVGSYALLGFSAEYKFSEQISTTIGASNLLDQNYSLAEGFPEPGRQFYANMRAKF